MKIRIDPLDTLFSKYIRLRANKHCERCGQYHEKGLQCCHFHSRRKQSVRYDPDNACACDFGCHQYLDSHPQEKIDFFKARLGEQAYDLLQKKARLGEQAYDLLQKRADTPQKIDRDLIGLYLKSLIKELEKCV